MDFQKIKKIVRAETNPLKKGFVRLEKKLDYSIDFMDKEHLDLRKRVKRVESELSIPTQNF